MPNQNITKKNILVITDSYSPKNNSGAIMIGDFVDYAHKKYNFIIITFNPKLKLPYSIKVLENQIIIYIKQFNINNYFIRFINEFLYSYKISKFFKQNYFIKVDFIITYSPSIFFGKCINFLKNKYSCKSYLIQRDIFPEWAFKQGLIKSKFMYHYLKKIEKRNYDNADYIGVESYGNLEYMKKNGYKNVELLSNWIKDNKNSTNKNTNNNSFSYYIYSGNLGLAQDFFSLLKEIKLETLKNNKIKILICGDGKQKNDILKFINRKSQGYVKYLGNLSREDYTKNLLKCKAGIVSLSASTFMSNYPFKFIDYLRNGIPVIAHINKNNELSKFINKNKIGLCSELYSYNEFNKNLVIMSKKKENMFFKKNCVSIFKHYFSIEKAFKTLNFKIE